MTENINDCRTEAGVAANLTSRLLDRDVVSTALEAGMLILPEGQTAHKLADLLGQPERVGAAKHFSTTESLRRYLDRFGLAYPVPELDANETADRVEGRGSRLAVFAQPKSGSYTCVLDYSTADTPDHHDHVATLQIDTTESYDTWLLSNKRNMDQRAFAEFLEDNIDAILDHKTDLLKAVKDLSATRKLEIRQQVETENGNVILTYADTTAQRGDVEVAFPETISVLIQPFEDGDAYKVACRLRYKIDPGLVFWYELVNLDKALKAAAQVELAKIEAFAGFANVYITR